MSFKDYKEVINGLYGESKFDDKNKATFYLAIRKLRKAFEKKCYTEVGVCANCPANSFPMSMCQIALFVDMLFDEYDVTIKPKGLKNGDCMCYHIENGVGVCWGTREKEKCNCDGVMSRCNFYPKRGENE